MQIEFAFGLGETVALKLSPETRCQILSRTAEECSGGVQLFYDVRGATQSIWSTKRRYDIQPNVVKVHEMELIAVPPGE